MADESNKNNTTLWKRFERISIVIASLSGLAVLIGFYYQQHTKKSEIQFQIISKDYLTTNNNIDRLKSNYEYAGIPVNNLWLIKFKIINSGDLTLTGTGGNESILDTTITFKFSNDIQILDKPNSIQNNFPDHNLKRLNNNWLSLSFQQWRKNESATYSLYLKSDKRNVSLLPSTTRLIKDGDILIVDLTNDQGKNRQPLLDILLSSPWTLICRIISILLAFAIFMAMNILFISGLSDWYKIISWKKKYHSSYKNYISSEAFLLNDSNFDFSFTKDNFKRNINDYTNNPFKIPSTSKFWKNSTLTPIVVSNPFISSWKEFLSVFLTDLLINIASISIILGLIV